MAEPTYRRETSKVFERFTDRSRRVVVLAQEEARLLDHNYIGTEHLLLGLIHEGEGVGARALENLGISLDAVRTHVREIVGQSATGTVEGHIPFTPRAKKVLELSLREALALGHNYIGTEHILLGLIREGEGVAAQVLARLGADLSAVRQEVIRILSGYAAKETPPTEPEPLRGHTPAGWEVTVQARRMAGTDPIGSQHYLLAALGDESSAASRAFRSLGLSREQLEQALRAVGTAGTSDETPEEAGARTLRLFFDGQAMRLEIEDPQLVAILAPLFEGRLLPPSISGDDPLAASFPRLWKAVHDTVHDIGVRAAAAADPDKPAT